MSTSVPSQILVTGGSGFIGTHLCRALVQAGHRVKVLDLRRPELPVSGVEYVQGDVREAEPVRQMAAAADAVFHFAALSSVPVCQQMPYESSRTNLLSTAWVLENMRPEARFIFSSSASVYGNLGQKGQPISEDLPLRDFLSFYAAQKFGSENLARQFYLSRGIQAVVFRFFNVYGPGQDPRSPYSGVISKFASAIDNGETLALNGGGETTRDFISIHDIVRGLMSALRCPKEVCTGEPINLGSGTQVSIRELAQQMMSVAGREVTLKDAPWREGDVPHSRAEIRRARERLGWEPKTDLKTGLAELLG